MRSELLAVKALNQYRRRDVLAYLGLRYYLESQCARSDLWSEDVATHLVSTRSAPIYFRCYHFKEMDRDGSVIHRNLYLPGPNEILAESALLHKCSLDPAFKPLSCVYSYLFPKPNSKEGIFRSYFPGFRKRHESIARICNESDKSIVQYTDIKRFYPTISKELARKVWLSVCDSSSISSMYRDLGERLLVNQNETAMTHNDGLGVLTGPMFTHLIANLILGKVDQVMFGRMGERYSRYVDDIALVGDATQVDEGRELLKSLLEDMGFSLHEEGKDFRVDSTEWLEGTRDFDDSGSKAWVSLIANIKRFLITKPEERTILAHVFSENGINIPLLDYSSAVSESSYVEKLSDWIARYTWAPKIMRTLTVEKLLEDAIEARKTYQNKIERLLAKGTDVQGYKRKRLIPKLRFYAGRLTFLASSDVLSSLSLALVNYPELLLQSSVMSTVQSRDVSSLLKLGANAVQAAAQVLQIQNDPVRCSLSSIGEVELQGIAALRLNGVDIDFMNDAVSNATVSDPLNQFALGYKTLELMKSDNLFVREIACLRGIENPLRHKTILNTAFDRDEQLVLDIINRLRDSSSF
ncbi:MAG: RNA-directed DNA polymerase [Anaerolineae bacterium]|nr:RNA-directed DNA polymerase [Anaerolineae bacterium]